MTRLERIIEGLNLLQSYGATDMGAEHDTIYVWGVNEEISDEHKTRLDELAFHSTDDVEPGSWERYV
jgi:hypothetical protein